MQNQTKLKSLGEEIKKNREIALAPLSTDVSKRRVQQGNITQAKEKLKSLLLDYRKEILSNAIFIIVTGNGLEEFTSISESNYDCFSVNTEDFYKELVKNTPEILYKNKPSSRSLLEFINNNLEEKSRELDIVSYPAMVFNSKYKRVLKDDGDFLTFTKQVFNDMVGAELVAMDAAYKIMNLLIDSELSGKKIPIILKTPDASVVSSLVAGIKRSVTKKVFVVNTGTQPIDGVGVFTSLETVNQENVEKTLINLNKSLV